MEYQYKTQVAEKFGLVILEDNTVLNSSGKLLVNGRKFKQVDGAPARATRGRDESHRAEDPCEWVRPPALLILRHEQKSSNPFRQLAAEYIRKNSLISDRDHVLAAVSGGPDSVALLSILADL